MAELAVLGLVMILGLGAYWSMVIFPRQREFQKRQDYVSELKTGDEIITYSGIVGRITEMNLEQGVVHIEIQPGVTMRVIAASIAREYDPTEFSSPPSDASPDAAADKTVKQS